MSPGLDTRYYTVGSLLCVEVNTVWRLELWRKREKRGGGAYYGKHGLLRLSIDVKKSYAYYTSRLTFYIKDGHCIFDGHGIVTTYHCTEIRQIWNRQPLLSINSAMLMHAK